MHPDDLNALADVVARMIDEALERVDIRHKNELEALKVEFEARLQAIPAGKDGRDGRDGKDGESVVGPQGERGERGEKGEIGPTGAEGPHGEKGERGEAGQRGEPGERGADGAKGENGSTGLQGPVGERGHEGPQGPAGKDGRDITPAEVRAIVEEVSERHFERFGLDFERRAQDRFQRTLDNMPKPKDGRDALELEDLKIDHDGDGNIEITFKRGEFEKTFFLRIPRIKYHGVFKEGTEYREGDSVTFAGSQFIAMKDAPEGKPQEHGDNWRLAVKRGRDGRDGIMKPGPDGGPIKL